MRHTKILALLAVLFLLAACVPAETQHTVTVEIPALEEAAPFGGATRGSNIVTTVDRLRVTKDLQVDGTTTNSGTQTYTGALAADGGITVDTTNFIVSGTTGATTIAGALTANGGISADSGVFTVADTSGNVHTGGTLDVDGNTNLDGTLQLDGAATLWSTLAMTATNAAGGSANPIDITSALGIMNGSDDYTAIDVNLTNADHTGSNTVQGLDISAITGDAEATETAVKIGTGWDNGISNASSSALDGGITVDTSNFTVSGTTGAVATASTVSAGTFLIYAQAATIAVTAGATITPLGTNQPITSTTGVTTSTSTAVANGSTAGQIVILTNNNASDTITVDGTGGNVECGGDVALGSKDSISLMWNGADWVCIGARDNNP